MWVYSKLRLRNVEGFKRLGVLVEVGGIKLF